ncbi:MAG TPA: asparaginase [Vicinamibacterales bacterium]|jgi:L-asparaginase
MRHLVSRRVIAVLVYAILAVAPASAQPAKPRVRLVATGGTISNKSGGRLTAAQLVDLVPGLDRYATPEYEQFSNLASGELSLAQWVGLTRRINELFETDPSLAGIVVTSGTDTLEELAYFLDLTVHSDKPVVVVGSMRNPSTLGYEGAANLLDAFRVAADPEARGQGVLVVLNDDINAAREVTKTDALRLDTFKTPGYGVLGYVDRDRITFYRHVTRKTTFQSEFDGSTLAAPLPRVDVLLVYQGAPGDLIKAAVDFGAKGIVIAAAGAGATSGDQDAGLAYALSKGAIVVITTRTGSGRIAPPDGPSQPPPDDSPYAGLTTAQLGNEIAGEDLEPVKARILLMLALTKTHDPTRIQRMFEEY